MARVLIKCPNTERSVSTVLRMREPAFESLTGVHAFRCTACNQIHSWSKQDAWLEPAVAAAG
jgi:hypothetical protein